METSMSRFHKPSVQRRQGGFTLIETMVAIVVLTVGLMSTAALMSSSVSTTARSHYMSTAAMLASEKLEDLDRFNKNDPAMVPGGSLGADTAGYFDNVQISSDNGGISETTSTGGVSTVYTEQPGGGVTVTQGAGLPAPTPDTLTFNRRWQVVNNSPVANVRTVTVLVTLTNQALRPPVTFQMSVVRP
jgi:prepilin-type N-terminal cleavage/methylation domain-containing protein